MAIEAKRLFYGDIGSVGEARTFVRDVLAETGASPDNIDSAVLLVSELATNVTLHARTDLLVSVRVDDGALWAQVRDWNPRLPQPCMAAPDATTGRGLLLVDALASRWGVERDAQGKVVWFALALDPGTSANGRSSA